MTEWFLLVFVAIFGSVYCIRLWWCLIGLFIEWAKLKKTEIDIWLKIR